MVDLSRIVSVVEIENVRLREAHCRAVHPSEIAKTLEVKPWHDAEVIKSGGGESLEIDVAFGLEVADADGEKEFQAEIRGTFELLYRIPADEDFSSEELAAFAQINAVFNAWPYWREFVQTSLARMDMPVLTVPVFRIHRSDSAEDQESSAE
ncbi:MAG: hypothetical protein F4Z04_17230 [Acidobacteria bacterium]|nr:hypothetical protein [Acidobacteriota bacterium]